MEATLPEKKPRFKTDVVVKLIMRAFRGYLKG